MSIDYASIIQALQTYNPTIAGVCVTNMMGDIRYTSNWSPDPAEIKRVVNTWKGGQGVSVTVSGVKFSILQATPERFVSTNIKKQGHLVGAVTPQGECVLGFVLPEGAYDGAYADIARAAGQLRPGGSAAALEITRATGATVYNKNDPSQAQIQAAPQVMGGAGAAGAQEVQQLLQWVQDPNGLAAYISYCIQNNDMQRLQAFSKFYRTLRQILG